MFDTLNDLNSTVSQNINSFITGVQTSKKEEKGIIAVLSNVQRFLLTLGIFATPFLFLPITLDWFEQVKILFTTAIFGLSLIVMLAKVIFHEGENFVMTKIDKAVVLLVVGMVVSSILSANQMVLRINSLLYDPVMFLAVALTFTAIVNTIKHKNEWMNAVNLLVWSIAGLGVLTTVQVGLSVLSGYVAPLRATLTAYPVLVNVSPTGGTFILGVVTLLALPIIIGLFKEEKAANAKVKNTVLLAITVVSLAVMGWFMFVNRPILLDHDTARKVATGVLSRSWTSALFGIGPSQFPQAFTLYRSADFNNSVNWERNFATSSNFWFYMLTVGGIISIFALVMIAFGVYKIATSRVKAGVKMGLEKYVLISLAMSLVLSILVPMAFLAIWMTFVTLGLLFSWYNIHGESNYAQATRVGKVGQIILGGTVTIAVIASLVGQGFNFAADTFYRQSMEAMTKDRGVDTFNLQLKAAQTAPWRDFYRVSLSQTNLALANALASKPGLSDQEKQTIVLLVQQALLEGRNAVALNPNASANWQNLAVLYRNLIGFAEGSDQWSVTSENQAITMSPFDPKLRLELGSLYFALNDFQNAAINYSLAAQLKPDFANAHYNLAQALKQLKVNDRALQELQQTQQLVCNNALTKTDCDRVNAEIDALKKPAAAKVEEKKPVEQPVAPNLPNAKTQPQVKISSPSGELAQ